MHSYIYLIFIAFSLGTTAWMVFMMLKRIRKANAFLQEGMATEGKVIDYISKMNKESSTLAPIVEYTALDGKTYRAKSDSYKNTYSVPDMGEMLPVFYKPGNPGVGMVDPAGVKKASLIQIVLYTAFTLVVIGFILYQRNVFSHFPGNAF